MKDGLDEIRRWAAHFEAHVGIETPRSFAPYDCDKAGLPPPRVSAVVAACNEADLSNTIESLRHAEPNLHEVIVVDDASDKPIPDATIRNETRRGVAVSRHIGCAEATGSSVVILDAHMRFRPGGITGAARIAEARRAIVYIGCNGHRAARLTLEGGIVRCKWQGADKTDKAVLTTAMMGACYVVPRTVLDELGGWIGLPGLWGCDEEAMSILAVKHRIPIIALPSVQNWHEFRDAPDVPYVMPYERYLVNIAATHRLLFEDATWARFKETLRGWVLDGRHVSIPDYLFDEVEAPDMLQYGEALRATCELDDAAFFKEIGVE